jgi:hypothetical protein
MVTVSTVQLRGGRVELPELAARRAERAACPRMAARAARWSTATLATPAVGARLIAAPPSLAKRGKLARTEPALRIAW